MTSKPVEVVKPQSASFENKPQDTAKVVVKPVVKTVVKPVVKPAKGLAKPAKKHAECKHNHVATVVVPAPHVPVVEIISPKAASAQSFRDEPVRTNKKINSTRLLLARVYLRLDDIQNSKSFYNQVIDDEPNVGENKKKVKNN